MLALLRTRLLGLPDRLAPLAHAEASLPATRDLIRGAIREALDELAETDVAPEPESEGDADPEPDGEPGAADAATATGADDQ